MTKSDFQKHLKRGLGRCVLALEDKNNRERFKSIVLNACFADFSYDLQSEGVRAEYVYSMICKYPDKEYFANQIIKAFDEIPEQKIDDFNHVSSLITCFAIDNYQPCKDALIKKYNELFATILEKRPTKSYNGFRDCFEDTAICLLKIGDESTLLNCVKDLGKLFTVNKYYDFFDFSWFHFCAEDCFGKKHVQSLLNKVSKTCEFTSKYLEKLEEYNQEEEKSKQAVKDKNNGEKINYANLVIEEVKKTRKLEPATRVKFKRNATLAEKQRIARYALKEIKYDRKMAYLSALENDIELIPCETLLEYATSPVIPLKKYALELLCNYKDPLVRTFAYQRVFSGDENLVEFFKMLINNFEQEDTTLFKMILSQESQQSFTIEDYHDLGRKILDSYEKRKLPIDCLFFIYENTPCAVCRNQAVELIYKNKRAFESIAKECLFDSFDNTRKLAKRYLKIN